MRCCLVALVVGCAAAPAQPPPVLPARAPATPPATPPDQSPADVCASAREGQRCAGEPNPCVVSPGVPCGWTSLLWCRGGRWVYETERNLCAEDLPPTR